MSNPTTTPETLTGITIIEDSIKYTLLDETVTYNPSLMGPAGTVYAKPGVANTWCVRVLCYIPENNLIPKSLQDFLEGSYADNPNSFTPTGGVTVQGTDAAATIVLAYFENINNVAIDGGVSLTSRTFAVCYDYENPPETYSCNLATLYFEYTVNNTTSKQVLFFAQGDLDPELSRGTISSPADAE